MAVLMTDREIAVPFRLDGQGRVAVVSDPDRIARQHLRTYLMTRPGERLMRPAYGTNIKNFLFDNLDPLQMSLLVQRVQEQVGADVRNVKLLSISAAENSDQDALMLTVEFVRAVGAGTTESMSLTLGGTA